MATAYELIKRANFLVDDEIEIDIALEFMNEALEDLSGVSGVEKTTTYTTSSGSFTFPFNTVSVVAVYILHDGQKRKASLVTDKEWQEHRYQTYSYRMFGQEIELFPKPRGSYQVIVESFGSYPKIPSIKMDVSIETLTGLPERFHRALSIYCAIQYAENDDNAYKINNLKATYDALKYELKEEMNKKKLRVRSKTVIVNSGWY